MTSIATISKFIYFYEERTSVNNTSFMLEKCDTTKSDVSIYQCQYKFRDGQLVNPKLLLDVPCDSNVSFQQIGGTVIIDRKDNKKSIKFCNIITYKIMGYKYYENSFFLFPLRSMQDLNFISL
jgi:hypothetical protein